ncbi:hypothetical protein GGS23DRAFT_619952 [Durotheca rogersii]|uniref:uncharacterized protein n=1 Tax=Durotheca rogersii TaxID=419775 RepID=UPI0022204161|nr:uncharacterized protein GGS23DRAFT_619952 [Durotheca rogersii]KAI5864140.1 hypothetical protein GGS23DRAFT_619952 [Durotheca rogersii]
MNMQNNESESTILAEGPSHPKRSRIPLSNKSNIATSLLTRQTPYHVTAVISTRWDHRDSSEGQPSSHGSIYDAGLISASELDAKSPCQTPDPVPLPATSVPPSPRAAFPIIAERPATPPSPPAPLASSRPSISPNSESPLSQLAAAFDATATTFLYGCGTELAPIREQRSAATLRTSGSRSTSNISSLMPPRLQPSRRRLRDGYHTKDHNDENENDGGPLPSRNKDKNNRGADKGNNFSTPPLYRQHILRQRRSFSMDDVRPLVGATATSTSAPAATSAAATTARSSHADRRDQDGSNSSRDHACADADAGIHAYPRNPRYSPHCVPRTPLGFAEHWMAEARRRLLEAEAERDQAYGRTSNIRGRSWSEGSRGSGRRVTVGRRRGEPPLFEPQFHSIGGRHAGIPLAGHASLRTERERERGREGRGVVEEGREGGSRSQGPETRERRRESSDGSHRYESGGFSDQAAAEEDTTATAVETVLGRRGGGVGNPRVCRACGRPRSQWRRRRPGELRRRAWCPRCAWHGVLADLCCGRCGRPGVASRS